MSKIENAVNWAIGIANDSSHGYTMDLNNRWGPDYDCSSLIISAWENAGVPVKSQGGCVNTGSMLNFLKFGFRDVTASVDRATGAGTMRGDVLLNTGAHTAMCIGGGQVVQASENEFGGSLGGKPGDQTGREIWITSYYNFPWNYVLRYNEVLTVTDVTINKSFASLYANESITLTATVLPSSAQNKDIVWSSSNTAVAVVNSTNGVVTAKAVGSAIITAKNNASGKYATCSIYVLGNINNFINRLFSNALGRQPDTTSLNNFRNVIKNDSACKAIFDVFDSSEYKGKNRSDDQFVTDCYKAILGRTPDESGKQNMLNLMNNGMSRVYILYQISNSVEFSNYCSGLGMRQGIIGFVENRDKNEKYTEFVSKAFVNGLGRKADVSGLNSFTGVLLNGGSGAQVMKDIFMSTEYANRRRTNNQYVQDLYATVLMRGAGADEIAGWVNELNAGKSRIDTLRGFVYTQEFINICTNYGFPQGTI